MFVIDGTGFINTVEGWALYGQCIRTGDIRPYYIARIEYYFDLEGETC